MGSREEVWALEQPVPPDEKVVLFGLAGYSGGGDEFGTNTRIALDYLCQLTTYPERRVRQILNRLYSMGYLAAEPHPRSEEREFRLVENPNPGRRSA